MIFISIKRKYEHMLNLLARLRKKRNLKTKTPLREQSLAPRQGGRGNLQLIGIPFHFCTARALRQIAIPNGHRRRPKGLLAMTTWQLHHMYFIYCSQIGMKHAEKASQKYNLGEFRCVCPGAKSSFSIKSPKTFEYNSMTLVL